MHVSVPQSGHGPTLYKEENDLRKMTGRNERDHHPEEVGQGMPSPVDDPQYAKAHGYLGHADANDIEYLRDDAPFECLR